MEGEKVEFRNPYSFTGAYTQDQALSKISATLTILEKVGRTYQPPFLVPLPIAAGVYPELLDPDNNPAYFIAFLVPYCGKRNGYLATARSQQEINIFYQHSYRTAPQIGKVLRSFHDLTNLAHCQPVLSNFYIPPDFGANHPGYLADFSTIRPISDRMPDLSKAGDLSHALSNGFQVFKHFISQGQLSNSVTQIFTRTMRAYLQNDPIFNQMLSLNLNVKGIRIQPTQIEELFMSAGAIVMAASKLDIIHHSRDNSTWNEIQRLQETLTELIKAA